VNGQGADVDLAIPTTLGIAQWKKCKYASQDDELLQSAEKGEPLLSEKLAETHLEIPTVVFAAKSRGWKPVLNTCPKHKLSLNDCQDQAS
jgi:hypothetical protein